LPGVDYFVDSQIAVISLDDAKNGNRLNLEFLQTLLEAIKRAIGEPDARAILVRSTAEPFCLGMDLISLTSRPRKDVEEAIEHYISVLAAIYTSDKPVVFLLDGDVKAGGVGLVCAGDIVLSTHKTTFELSEVLFGLIPANVLPYLFSLRISPQKARYLILTSKRIAADEAFRLGLVDELFREEEFERGVRNILKRLLRSSPFAMAETKSFTARLIQRDLDDWIQLAREEFLKLTSEESILDAVMAFDRGDLPEWFSRYRPRRPLTFSE